MKGDRGNFRMLRREQLMEGFEQDSYKAKGKLPEPTRCPKCGATYHNGRWTWDAAPAKAHEQLCPACHRIHDQFPAGYVTLKGTFLHEHRDEILRVVRSCEDKEKSGHPLQRIMAIENTSDGMLVTTTDSHLARDVAVRLHDAYKGELEFHYNKEENLLRATWQR